MDRLVIKPLVIILLLSHTVALPVLAQSVQQSAEVKQRVDPRYPMNQASKGQEGWVQLSFVIDEQGQVTDPFIIDSSGIKGFEKAALRAVSQWQYTPAVQNGKTVQQCENKVQLDFRLADAPKGGTRKFVRALRKFQQQLEANNLQEAATILEEMEERPRWNHYEDVYFNFAKSNYARATGDAEQQLTYLDKALFNNHDYLSDRVYAASLQDLFILEVQQKKLMDALETFEVMQNTESDLAHELVKGLQPAVAKIHQFINGENPFSVDARIGKRGYWGYTLSRKAFSFADISGQIDDMDIRCDKHRDKFKVELDKMWRIPVQWGECHVFVRGEQGASVKLIEMPNKQPARL